MAVMVMVSVNDGTGIQKVSKKYAVMLNKLLTVICILPGVDSSEDLSSSNYSSTTTTTSTISTTSTTSTTPTTSTTNSTFSIHVDSNKKILPVIGTILSILTVITACCTFYHEFYKTKSNKNGGNNYVYFCNEKTVNNNVCNKSVTIPTTIDQNQIETKPNPDQKINLFQD